MSYERSRPQEPGGALRYLAVGDSVACGFRFGLPRRSHRARLWVGPRSLLLRWFERPEDGYAARLARLLEAELAPVDSVALTAAGASVETFWERGMPAPLLARAVRELRPQLVTVTLGANDLLWRWPAYLLAAHLVRRLPAQAAGLSGAVQSLAPGLQPTLRECERVRLRLAALLLWLGRETGAVVVVTTYYNGDESRAVGERFLEPLTRAITTAAAAAPGTHLVDLAPLFAGHGARRDAERWISAVDGLHPTDAGADAIAAELLRATRAPLSRLLEETGRHDPPTAVALHPGEW